MASKKQSTHSPHTAFQLLEGEAYYHALLQQIPKAKTRIVLASMLLLAGPRTDEVFKYIKAALERGVRVHILLDNYTRLPLVYKVEPAASKAPRLKRTFAILSELEELGTRISYVGKLGLQPYRGRCHIKVTIVDDYVYSFGGINFYDESLTRTDYMLACHDAAFAACLEQLVDRVGNDQSLADTETEIDTHHTVLFDGGQPKHSIIYERACELTTQAARVYYVSQMTPSGDLGKLLHETNATCYFNRPSQMQRPDRWGQAFDQERWRITNHYRGGAYIHAKFMLFELKSGKRALLSGSNNFSYRGIAYGTQEVALFANDEGLWQRLYEYMRTHIQEG